VNCGWKVEETEEFSKFLKIILAVGARMTDKSSPVVAVVLTRRWQLSQRVQLATVDI